MYSPEIVERRLHAAKKAGLKFQRLPRDKSIDIANKLEALTRNDRGDLIPDGGLVRPLDEKEFAHITSERIICRADFEYYLTRYHYVERDPGVGTESGNGAAVLLESQRYFIHKMGQREDVCYRELKEYGHTAGILILAHKCRQVAFTATSRGASIHRMIFYPGTRAMAGTLKDGPQGTGELYKRDLLTLNNLPFWMKPVVSTNVKDQEIGFEHPLSCRLSYQSESGQLGIGTGSQQDVSHLTEVPLWSKPGLIRYSFYPSLPKAVTTLHIQEGTSAGKGDYWQEVTEGCRRRKSGYEDWTYIFVPVYVNRKKYRGNPPGDWVPNEHTVKYAELVERTSPEFCSGVTVHPERDHLFWWEKTRALHASNGELASFLSNYPCTPEQSFTNWALGAIPLELLEEMEFDVRPSMPYEVSVST